MILIIDADRAMRESLQLLLECRGFAARGYGCVSEFLERQWPDKDDCLILDLDLPDVGCLDFLEMLRRDGSSVPAVVIAGGPGSLAQRRRAGDLGPLAWLERPYVADELLGLVRGSLQGDNA